MGLFGRLLKERLSRRDERRRIWRGDGTREERPREVVRAGRPRFRPMCYSRPVRNSARVARCGGAGRGFEPQRAGSNPAGCMPLEAAPFLASVASCGKTVVLEVAAVRIPPPT